MLNKNLLRSKMTLYGDTYITLAKAIGISLSRFSAKMNGANFDQEEIFRIKQHYNLTAEEVSDIFFNPDVS